jgi:hypothetical protein
MPISSKKDNDYTGHNNRKIKVWFFPHEPCVDAFRFWFNLRLSAFIGG